MGSDCCEHSPATAHMAPSLEAWAGRRSSAASQWPPKVNRTLGWWYIVAARRWRHGPVGGSSSSRQRPTVAEGVVLRPSGQPKQTGCWKVVVRRWRHGLVGSSGTADNSTGGIISVAAYGSVVSISARDSSTADGSTPDGSATDGVRSTLSGSVTDGSAADSSAAEWVLDYVTRLCDGRHDAQMTARSSQRTARCLRLSR